MDGTDNPVEVVGKKIFFLYPTVVVQNRIISELVQQEFEVYVAKNKDKLKKVLKKHPDSIVLIDIDEHMPEKEWDLWITALLESSDTKTVSIGIVTENEDEAIQHKYLVALKVPCGYTVLRTDLDKSISNLVSALQAVNAKGRRKYIRAVTEQEAHTTVNLPWGGAYVHGRIKDVSVVGISCTLDGSPEISKNTLLKNIQIKLQTNLLKVEGIVFGSRTDGMETVYVILFTQRIDPDVRIKIRKYIQHTLQNKMDFELK
jgi:hypothetical protein